MHMERQPNHANRDPAPNDLTYVLPHLVDFIEVLAVPGSGGLLLATTAATAAAGPWSAGLRFLTGAKVRREGKRRRDERCEF